ncbi:putative Zinc finger C3HC4 type (RING finger) Prokaryotic RING finger family 4 [Trypanosoma vivax]|uniref:RING-type domain-containing protein n=1 Tax=Trypanosoma vivax (strain Y486) TaxID=1055687 RepID=G0U454_TRYVY|nr:hypothetical protein TRVL_00676 [Trypanosoma vivax]KAH8611459.1 putative Zinc finger C3HC4 type (RING finger) Prokaryotic RING finger family 4 [Trypanosoma vivax]CCC52216.1 conserved hypothetical protein [Trypanosoma vivax Y486]
MGGTSSRPSHILSHVHARPNVARPPPGMPPHLASQYGHTRPIASNNGARQHIAPPPQPQPQPQQQQTTNTAGAGGSWNGVQEGEVIKILATVDTSSVTYDPVTRTLFFSVISTCPHFTYEVHTAVRRIVKDGSVLYTPNKPKLEPMKIDIYGLEGKRDISVVLDTDTLSERELAYDKHYSQQQPCVIVLRYQSAPATGPYHTGMNLEVTEHTAIDLSLDPKQRVVDQVVTTGGDVYVVEDLFGADGDGCTSDAQVEVTLGAAVDTGNMEEEDTLCVVCIAQPKDTVVMPCRHLCLCKTCAEELLRHMRKCPVCRGKVSTLLHMPKTSNNGEP